MKKFFTLLSIGSVLFFGAIMAQAINITVPSAPSAGYWLTSTTTGAYISTTTSPIMVGSVLATSTTATSTFAGGVSVGSQILVPSGINLTSAPGYSFTGFPNYGMYLDTSSGFMQFVGAGSKLGGFYYSTTKGFGFNNGNILSWNGAADGAPDTSIARLSAGVIGVGTASVVAGGNSNGTLIANTIGIGTTSPYSMLSVAGQVVGQNFIATSTVASSTFATAVGINLTQPSYAFDVSGGTNNTAQFYDQTPSSGITKVIIKSGANQWVNDTQSDNAILKLQYTTSAPNGNDAFFETLNNVGTILTKFRVDGGLYSMYMGSTDNKSVALANSVSNPGGGVTGVDLGSGAGIGWSNPGVGVEWWRSPGLTLGETALGTLAVGTTALGQTNGTILAGMIGLGTTSPFAVLQIASSTKQLLDLSDASLTTNHWDMRVLSDGGLYIGTSSASTYATSTPSAFVISSNGLVSHDGKLPTVATSTGSGSGSVPVTLTGNPNDLNFNIVTGSAPAGSNATIATFTLPSACPTATIPEITSGNANAGALSGNSHVFASSTAPNAFSVFSNSTGLSATTNYIWNIHVGCY